MLKVDIKFTVYIYSLQCEDVNNPLVRRAIHATWLFSKSHVFSG